MFSAIGKRQRCMKVLSVVHWSGASPRTRVLESAHAAHGLGGEMSRPLHSHRTQNRFKPGERLLPNNISYVGLPPRSSSAFQRLGKATDTAMPCQCLIRGSQFRLGTAYDEVFWKGSGGTFSTEKRFPRITFQKTNPYQILGPKSAVPIRTRVAPSSTAASKSPVMPIESSFISGARVPAWIRLSRSSRSWTK